MDQFGNYLVEKMIDLCDEEQRTLIVRVLTSKPLDLIQICLNNYGYAFPFLTFFLSIFKYANGEYNVPLQVNMSYQGDVSFLWKIILGFQETKKKTLLYLGNF